MASILSLCLLCSSKTSVQQTLNLPTIARQLCTLHPRPGRPCLILQACIPAQRLVIAMKRKGDPQDAALTRISKDMSRILRHAPPQGEMDSEGWVRLPALLKALRQRATEDIVRQITEENDKVSMQADSARMFCQVSAATAVKIACPFHTHTRFSLDDCRSALCLMIAQTLHV